MRKVSHIRKGGGRRAKIGKKASKRIFKKAAARTNRLNVSPRPMRGGIRM